MSFVLIDPPVTPLSSIEEIEAWAETLRNDRAKAQQEGDDEAVESYDDALATARRWIDLQTKRVAMD